MMWEVLKGTIRMQIHPDGIKASHLDKTAPLPLVEVGQVGKEKSGGGLLQQIYLKGRMSLRPL